GNMFAALTLVFTVCLTATTLYFSLNQMSLKGEIKTHGAFTYDSTGKKLRFRSNESHPTNTSLGLDLLMFFDKGVFYEIDSKNQSCEKKSLHSVDHPLDIPDDAKFCTTVTTGSASIEGEGLKVNMWTGSMHNVKGTFNMFVTMGCLPVTTLYSTDSTSFLFSTMEVENEIKEPDLLMVPSFCEHQPLEETPEGTVNSFFNEFVLTFVMNSV
uniref:Ependymin n=1 Tax=Periophthalmus magnuspinnatus TaxID=409849 RepID=A0A3B3ZEV1_9GOBI